MEKGDKQNFEKHEIFIRNIKSSSTYHTEI